jgi:hypothetical protein
MRMWFWGERGVRAFDEILLVWGFCSGKWLGLDGRKDGEREKLGSLLGLGGRDL